MTISDMYSFFHMQCFYINYSSYVWGNGPILKYIFQSECNFITHCFVQKGTNCNYSCNMYRFCLTSLEMRTSMNRIWTLSLPVKYTLSLTCCPGQSVHRLKSAEELSNNCNNLPVLVENWWWNKVRQNVSVKW